MTMLKDGSRGEKRMETETETEWEKCVSNARKKSHADKDRLG